MAAQVYSSPDHIKLPELSGASRDLESYFVAQEKYRQDVVDWAKANSNSKSDLVGEIINCQIADGYASYVVLDTKPLELLHLEDGDAYDVGDVTMRGLRVSDIRDMVRRDKKIHELFSPAPTP